MAGFEKIEDIDAWKEARAAAASVCRMTSKGAWAKDWGLRDQIRRAAVSVACNIAEGFGRETDSEFHRFLAIARGSATEVKTQLYIALDLGYLERAEFAVAYKQLDRISRMLTGLMQYLKRKKPNRPSTDDLRPTTRET